MEITDVADGRRRAGQGGPLVEVRGLAMEFGGILALRDVSFDVLRGYITGLIGPNGAGKTTLFNCLSRLYKPTRGDIVFDGRSISQLARSEIAELGIARTFQNVALFDKLSVLDNVLVGGHVRSRSGFAAHIFKTPAARQEERRLRERACELADFMSLGAYLDREAGGLPFPIRKRIELARALMIEPKLLLLDEPAAGLNHEEVEVLKDQIHRIRDRFSVSVLLVEHHMNLVMSISDRVVALDFGQKIADGVPDEVRSDKNVIRAYLGGDA